MNKTTIYLKPTPARKRALMINDALPGIILLINGIAYWGDQSAHGKYALINIIVGIAVIIAFRFELKTGKHKVVNWFDIIAGIVLIVEGINKHHPDKIFQPALFYFLLGIIIITRGIFHSRFPSIRKLIYDDSGFTLRPNPLRGYKLTWKEITSLEMIKTTIYINTQAGKSHKVNLRRVENRNEIFETMNKYTANK
jgi:hypothetical protein